MDAHVVSVAITPVLDEENRSIYWFLKGLLGSDS
jgi:hypothetical protein